MKKVLSVLTVLLLCVSMVLPVFAAEDGFVPSITYKPNPELVPVTGEDGLEHVGVVRNASGEVISYVDEGCLQITPIAAVWDEEAEAHDDVKRILLFVYDSLNDGSMTIPYEKHEADLDPANMVIRDLFDARWSCEEHPEMLEPQGIVMELTFDLGVVADAQIFVQTYNELTGEWTPIAKTVNNGDGTVTCTFEHLCAVAFSMPVAATVAPAEQVEQPGALPWIIALIVAAVGAVGVVIAKNKKKTTV